ncbi:SDR family NAD(P)-dependent oxidoreductase [Novosphingobium mathurense]|uniref:NAD(P)-dependent dehydrogenase, short-chain alcohol dehydrogenase family n=1 Tax=Novosphingobium mathurense TaxID=428990 RepID=A0A1U6IIQ5_9SPHN|nr:SDR family oxidoreductase [Novosphingobium mathurense]SLK07895.1 NAD(P)-dependent dehydrogenase, short-chain alcohol dehydrogenase family [Novosphingobium mathurense]
MGRLEGKVAVILGVGALRNMGQAIAQRYVREGAKVVLGVRDEAGVKPFADSLGAAVVHCDITSEADLKRLMNTAVERFGRLDIAVNASGATHFAPFLEEQIEDLRRITDIQFIGTFQFIQAALRVMADGGSVIQISSVTAIALLPNHATYMATKAAGDLVVSAVAAEFGARGIRVNSIAPGPTADTPMAAPLMANPTAREQRRSATPLQRLGTADDIAEAALWLATDENFITGQVLQVNGGRAIHRLQ